MQAGDKVKAVGYYSHHTKQMVQDQTTHDFLNEVGVIDSLCERGDGISYGYTHMVKFESWYCPVPFNEKELEVVE